MFVEDIVTILNTAGQGVAGVSIFWGTKSEPTGDGPFITIIETGGTGPKRVHNAAPYRRPSAQIVVRAKGQDVARAKADAVWNALDQKRNLTVNGNWYVSIDTKQEPFDMGLDGAGRIRFAFNIECVKR